MINAVPLPLKITFTFRKVPRFQVKPGCPIAAASTHQHLHTRRACMRSLACLQKKSVSLSSCLSVFHFAAPQAPLVHTTQTGTNHTNAYKAVHGRTSGESQFASLSFLQQINWALQNSAFDRGSLVN